MQNSIFSWIRKQQFLLQIFVAVMVNLMAFAQPLNFVLNKNSNIKHIPSGANYSLFGAIDVNENKSASIFANKSQSSINKTIPQKNSVAKSTVVTFETKGSTVTVTDANSIPSIEKQGIIGKSENLPIDELTDNIFSFELKNEVKKDKDLYLEYELFGLADGSQAIKSINDQMATGGSIIKTTKEWTMVKEKVNPSDIQKGKNNIKFTTWEASRSQYMVRNLKLVYENKAIEMPIEFHQSVAKSYSGSIAVSGFIADPTILKVSVLGKDYPVINGVFEVLAEEKEPKQNLTVSYIDAKGNKIENSINVMQLLDKPTEIHKENKTAASISKFFAKSQHNSLTFGGAQLQVDTLSLDQDQKISIAGLRYVDVPTLSPEMVNVTADYYGYRMLPHGDLFSKKPAKIILKYDQAKLPTGYTTKDIKTFYFDTDQKRWMALQKDTLLDASNEIVSKTNHFTDFINGIIKVPESPETSSFTPTSIKDIKAAEPTAGVVSIAPPTPNNMGTVNTSFPIKLPAGRAGMQPSLAVSYSSEGGNGWMGLGWDLSIPGVSLDTRWGAPRYDAVDSNGNKIETEIYSIGGGMLTLDNANPNGGTATPEYTNPHRKDNLLRNTNNQRQFYPRIEGSYAKIIRHGNNPNNYWWEVTDKMGNKSFYGGYGTAVEPNAVVKTSSGNIAYWGLYKTEDTNGNYVEYIYYNQNAVLGGAPGDGGNEFYIKEIKYTMHKTINQPNYYKVDFLRTGGRVDKQINARNGVVQVTKDLLTEIKIGLQGASGLKPIRSYGFEYKTPSQQIFYKSQLTKISEFDASGDLFYSNTMEYETKGVDRNPVDNNNFIQSTVDDHWNKAGNDGIKGDLIVGQALSNVSTEFSNEGSALGSSEDGGGNFGSYVGFGPPCPWSNNFTGGVNFGFGGSSGGGLSSFMDVNGDGLPDKVFRQDKRLKFRPNLGNGFGGVSNITGITNISRNSSNNQYVGVQASFGGFIGITYNTSESITSTYFSDVNGDGMPDLVDGGLVKFNKAQSNSYLNSVDFSPANATTSNPVSSGSISKTAIASVKLKTLTQLNDENPQHDIVKVWIAKKSGVINISGDATISPLPATVQNPYPTNDNDEYFNDYDGVRLSIQQNDGINSVKLENVITPTFSGDATVNTASQNMSLNNVTVQKGDRIYFRMQSRKEGSYDRVQWNPTILYSGTNEIDANGLSYFSSSAADGFILSANTLVAIPNAGTVSFNWPPLSSLISANVLSDNLTFRIEQGTIGANGFSVSNVYNAQYNSLTGGSINASDFFPALPNTVSDNTVFKFSVLSKSNVDWRLINWNPKIVFTPNTGSSTTFYGLVNYQIYNKKINSDVISRIEGINPTSPLVIKPIIDKTFFQSSSLPDNKTYNVNLIVKNDQKRVIATRSIAVNKFSSIVSILPAAIENIDINDNITSTVFVEYYTSDIDIANLGSDASQPIKAEIYQANTIATPVALTPSPPTTTLPASPDFISRVTLHTLVDANLFMFPYYQDRTAINNPNLIKGAIYPLKIDLATITSNSTVSKHAAAWIDYNRDGSIDVNEFFASTTPAQIHNFNVTIPSTIVDGAVLIRVLGGASSPYTILDFTNSNSVGTVRDYQANIVSYTNKFSKDIYCAVENDKFGVNYRGWGQFAYHGGIIIQRGDIDKNSNGSIEQNEHNQAILTGGQPTIIARYGETATGVIIPIDESALIEQTANPANKACTDANPDGGQPLVDCLKLIPPTLGSSIRFFRLNPNAEKVVWNGANESLNVEANFFSCSRLGVKNLKSIFTELNTSPTIAVSCGFPNVYGVSLVNKGEGESVSGGFSILGANPSTSFNWAELSYMDLNGDRYPDLLTKNNIQFTNSLGGLAETRNLGYGRPSSGSSCSRGASASGTFNTSKTPDPKAATTTVAAAQGTTTSGSSRPAPQVKSAVGLSGSGGQGENTEGNLWIDMNGDGLPDRIGVDNGIQVSLNLGYGFDAQKTWVNGTDELKSSSSNFSGGAGFSIADNSYSAGVSVSASHSYTESNISDINGDGLPDLLLDSNGGNFQYRLNTGNGFEKTTRYNTGFINYSRSTAEGFNGAFTIPICFFFFGMVLSFNGGADQSLTRTENTIEDINGDGFPDVLSAGNGGVNHNDGELHARLSNIGTTNYLTKVNTPTGGSWEVSYARIGNTFDMPQSKYVLDKISVYDGFTNDNNWSTDRTVTSVAYTKPYYDRREREFFGFETVKVNQHGGFNTAITDLGDPSLVLPDPYRYSVQEFHNKNYYLKGAIKKESLFDANNVMWTESKTTYGIYKPDTALSLSDTKPVGGTFGITTYDLSGLDENAVKYLSDVTTTTIPPNNGFVCTDLDHSRLFVTPLVSVKTFTEGGTGLKYAVTAMETLDEFGNITQYRDYGEQGTDVYVSKISYLPSISGISNSVGFPEFVRVYQADGATLQRERQATYDSTTGNLFAVITKLNGTQNASVAMEYDTFGNLSKVTNQNSVDSAGNKYFKNYTYDSVLNTFPTRVEDAFGYFSTSEYNFLFGIPVYTKDMNLQPMRTRVDDRGRPIDITGPYELYVEGITGGADPAWTIRFEYQNEKAVATSLANFASDQFGAVYTDIFNGVVNATNSFVPNTTNKENNIHHALTRHFDPEYRANPETVTTTNQILTATLVDGLGKPVQVKKSAAIFDGSATVSKLVNPINDNNMVWLLNGKAKTDEFGRAIASYYPTTQSDTFTGSLSDVPANAYTYSNAGDTVVPTEATYDVLDRSLTTQLPGESEQTTMNYSIDANSFATVVTNELGQVQKSYTDVRGRTTQTLQESLTGNIATNFVYNNIGELQTVTDVAGNVTESLYDLAGRRTELHHPDNGITKFTYDQASNLIKRETANQLQAGAGEAIEYKYTFNRLDEIKYPKFPENNVHYYYGTAENSDASNDNAVGRLWYHVDASGTQYFKYGKLGELTKNRRSVAVPGDRVYWFQTDWTYDTWNRVKTITYPDQEIVTYKYNKGGELHGMTSEKNGEAQANIISQLGYDKFGQRTYLRYGNGTETTYNYQAERRRLDKMKVQSSTAFAATSNRTFINNKYDYDVLSNVKGIYNNTVALPTNTQIGGRSWQEYTYDDLNRLTTAAGSTVGRNENGVGYNHNKYTLAMSYDSQHNIASKMQQHETATSTTTTPVAGTWLPTEQTTYGLDYQDYNTAGYTVAGYTYNQPHAPRKIIDQPLLPGVVTTETDTRIKTKNYQYDYNGNQTVTTQKAGSTTTPDILRKNLWDEENRLRAIDLNPESSAVHPIALYTYDAGGERIIKQNATSVAAYENALNVGTVTKSDFMLYPSGMVVARPAADGTGALSYTKHYFAGAQRVSSKIGTTTNLGQFLQDWTLQENGSGGAPINLVATSKDQLTKAETGVTYVYTALAITPIPTFNSNQAFVPVADFKDTGKETEQYYFHPDHLGSSNYITNLAGEVSQHMEYFAFGETFVEEHKNSINSPYKFNGKELDEESGLYYYGARYYDPRISIWASIDPLAEKFVGRSSYEYCFSSPVKFIDPTGMGPGDPPTKLYHNTTSASSIIKNGFNASENGKLSNYNWFSSTSDAGGTGRTGQGTTLGVEGINVSNAVNVSNSQIKGFYNEAKAELGYTSEQLKGSSALRSEVDGLKFKKLGNWMNSQGAESYKIGNNYAVSDGIANGGVIQSVEGSAGAVKALNGLRVAGKVLTILAIAVDSYQIYSSGFNPRVITGVAGGWAGAYAGAELGAIAGTGIGVWIGGVGEIVTAPVGGLIGGAIGYFGGKAAATTVYDKVTTRGVPIGGR
jgi:RHS repeat-associated protein